jgi:glycosyltransferase involved in cell wall biosynthesis
MWKLIDILQGLSVKVTFAAAQLPRVEPYVSRLQRQGVEVLYAPFVASVIDHLRAAGPLYDLVLLSRPDVAGAYLDGVRLLCPRARVVYDSVDLYFVREAREAALSGDPALQAAADARKRQELGVMARADIVLAVTPVDRDIVRAAVPEARVEIVSDVQDVSEEPAPHRDRHDLLFLGGFMHRPNVDAVRYFVEEIFPLVRRRLPGVRLHVVGSHAPPEVFALAAADVLVAGYEEDVAPRFAAARVFVAPLRYGSGVKAKITRALSHGLPVVATPVAVEGMRLQHERELLVAEAPEDFAAAVARLYTDAALWTRLQWNGLQAIARLYSRQAARTTLQHVIAAAGST